MAPHVFPWSEAARRSGLRRVAVYPVRPDGYIGSADPGAGPAKLERHLDSRAIRPLNTPGSWAAPARGGPANEP